MTWWSTETLPPTVEPATLVSDRQILHDHVRLNVGTVPLAMLTPEQVEAMMRR